MNTSDLLKRLTAEFGTTASPKAVIEAAMAHYQKALHRGESIELLGLMRVQLSPKALSGETHGREAINILPLRGLFPEKPASSAPQLVSQLAIVVDELDPFFKVMQKKLTTETRQVALLVGLAELQAALAKQTFDAVIVDGLSTQLDEISHFLKTDAERSLIALIVLYQENQKPPLTTLRLLENVALIEPYTDEKLSQTIDAEVRRARDERKYFQHSATFALPANPAFQQSAAEIIEALIAKSGLSEAGQMGLLVGFRESVDNAIRHGSKSIDNPIVEVGYVLDNTKITITIKDHGKGFDSSKYLTNEVSGDAVSTARTRHKAGQRGGLGIMLMLKSLDKLTYNREGTQATLTKFLKPIAKR